MKLIYETRGVFWAFYALTLITVLNTSCKESPSLKPIRKTADLGIGETQDVKLSNGDVVKLSLLEISEVRDSIRDAMRAALVKISVDGEEITLLSGNYNLPVTVGKVQIDCPVTKGYYSNAGSDFWKLSKEARFRLWPAGSSYIDPGTFVYPIKQRWFANMTQLSNEPCYVDWGENSAYTQNRKIYYHAGNDIGGAEGFDEIVSATDGLIVSSKNEILAGYDSSILYIHPDAVEIIDDRGWIIEYAHLDSILPEIKSGERVKMGQKIGYIGKQGGSGGWVHLHFEIRTRETPAGEWRIEDAYPYMWESYRSAYNPSLVAVARPHHLLWTGQEVVLDGRKSKSFVGHIITYEWTFCDGTTTAGAVQKKTYEKPGEYSEILKVTDSKGNVDYDFTVVQVYNRKNPQAVIPVMQSAYHPTLDIRPGDPITFLVRTFNTESGNEVWDFGDGSGQVRTKSYVDPERNTEGKFAETVHSYTEPGQYIVTVARSDSLGISAISHLKVQIGE